MASISSSSNIELTEQQKERIRANREEALRRRKLAEEKLILQQQIQQQNQTQQETQIQVLEQYKQTQQSKQQSLQQQTQQKHQQPSEKQQRQINSQEFQQQQITIEIKNKNPINVDFKLYLLSAEKFKVCLIFEWKLVKIFSLDFLRKKKIFVWKIFRYDTLNYSEFFRQFNFSESFF